MPAFPECSRGWVLDADCRTSTPAIVHLISNIDIVRRFALSIRLLYRLLTVGLLCLLANADEVGAAESSIKVIQNGIRKGNLVMQFRAEGVFSEKVIKFLNRGFSVKLDYEIELWQRRKYWFDRLDSQHGISYQVEFEPLEKRYICLKSRPGAAITSKLDKQLDAIILWVSQPDPPLTIAPVERLAPQSEYYYNIEILIATLTAENVKQLQRWLGEFGGKEKEPSTVTEKSLGIVADFLSSRNHKKLSGQSERFRPVDLPRLDS